MLVLTRKLGEKILIGDDITITVVEVGKARVKVGIEAPKGHRILRSELVLDVAADAEPAADAGMIRTQVTPVRRPIRRRATESLGV